MRREFHIFAFESEARFVMKSIGEGYPREFRSLFEATCHARTQPGCDGGLVVIYDRDKKAVNRIPFQARR